MVCCGDEISGKTKHPDNEQGPLLVALSIKVTDLRTCDLNKLGVHQMRALAKLFGCKGVRSSTFFCQKTGLGIEGLQCAHSVSQRPKFQPSQRHRRKKKLQFLHPALREERGFAKPQRQCQQHQILSNISEELSKLKTAL